MALFGSGAPDHPMAGIRQAKKLISELPANDSVKALDEVSFWLDSISRTEGFKVDRRFRLIDLLDQAAKGHQRKLAQEYLATDRQEKFRENTLWNTVFNFWKHLGDAYGQCVEQIQSGASSAGAIGKELPVIVARTLRALTLQLKWDLLHYGPVDDRLWGELGQLYLYAEAKRITTGTIEIYPGAHGQGTVQQEFLKAMMLGVSSTGGLTPLKQEIAERTVAHFGSLFTLQAQPTPGCNDFFDLSMRMPPARVMKGLEPSAMTRFFGAGKALPELEQLIEQIKATDTVPPHVNLGGIYASGLVLSAMRQLAMYWSDQPPARSSGRRQIATRLTVVHGFLEVLRAVESPVADEALDIEPATSTESWIVENVSEGGFGAVIPHVKGDWIKVGTILAVQTEASQLWAAAIIRRIARDEYQLRHVGIQLLAQAVIPVRLAPAGNASLANAMREGEPGVLLSTTPDAHGEIALLLRGGSYRPGQGLEMNVRGMQYHLAPSELVEGGDDFDWAKLKVMQRA